MKLILLSATLSSGLAMGFPGIDAIKAKAMSSHIGSRASAEGENCIDFSGHWKGTCQLNDGTQDEEETRIDQFGCESMIFDEAADITLGGVKTESESSPIGGYTHYEVVDWADSTKQAIGGTLSGVSKTYSPQAEVPFTGSYAIRMDGEELVMRSDITMLGQKISEECRLSKQP
ncbi:MAG: hypothetical protein AB7T49_14525 [Oligoflexales bacterium]